MSTQQTEKSSYPSIYSPNKYVSAAQYIIELVCQKKAYLEQKHIGSQFWKNKLWANFFKMQLRKCHSLLKKYDEKAIMSALKHKNARNIRSLMAPWLLPLIKEEQEKLDILKKKQGLADQVEINRGTTSTQPRQPQNNFRSKLEELDE